MSEDKHIQEALPDVKEEDPAPKEIKIPPISRQKINQCMMDIEDNHPLYDIVKFQHILPEFSRCFKPAKPTFKTLLRKVLLTELKLKLPKTDKKIARNPFLLLGYGVNSYFNVLS